MLVGRLVVSVLLVVGCSCLAEGGRQKRFLRGFQKFFQRKSIASRQVFNGISNTDVMNSLLDPLRSQITDLRNSIIGLGRQLAQKNVVDTTQDGLIANQGVAVAQAIANAANNIPKCPTGTTEINTKCYTVETTMKTFPLAMQECFNKRGFLAEPVATEAAVATLLAQLRVKFAAQFTTINVQTTDTLKCLLIGLEEKAVDDDFMYKKSGGIVLKTDTILVAKDAAKKENACIFTSGTNINKFDTLEATLSRFFFCEYKKA